MSILKIDGKKHNLCVDGKRYRGTVILTNVKLIKTEVEMGVDDVDVTMTVPNVKFRLE